MKKIIVLAISLVLAFNLYAQPKSNGNIPASTRYQVTNIQSPNIASLGLYGDFPVSYFTGTPSIEIPLYEIPLEDKKIPITLSYHSSSVRPDQHPGWIGLGWNLNAGGAIYRSVQDLPDEYSNTQRPRLANIGYYFNHNLLSNSDWNKLPYLRNIAQGEGSLADTQPDIFSFNFLGFSGHFYMSENGKWEVESRTKFKVIFNDNFVDVPLSKRGTNREFYENPCVFSGFTLISDDGTQYVFGESPNAIEYSMGFFDQYYDEWVANAWYLTKIISPKGNSINFVYERGDYVSQMYISIYADLGSYTFSNGDDAECSSFSPPSLRDSYNGKLISPVYLNNISFDIGSLEFKRDSTNELKWPVKAYESKFFWGRKYTHGEGFLPILQVLCIKHSPLNYFDEGYPECLQKLIWYKLSSIHVKNKKGNLCKDINLNYDDMPQRRLSLQSVVENAGVSGSKSYSFEYSDMEKLPPYLSNELDHWGYYNGRNAELSPYLEAYSKYREPSPKLLTYGVLSKITYPTGGYTRFVFEPNDYRKQLKLNRWEGCEPTLFSNQYAGGTRIKQIINSATGNASDEIVSREYYYTSDYLQKKESSSFSSGVLGGQFQYYFTNYIVRAFNDMDAKRNIKFFSSNSVLPACNNSGSHIGYTEVIEKFNDKSFNRYIYSNFDNGYLDAPCDAIIQFSRTPYTHYASKEQERGLLLRQEAYNSNKSLVSSKDYAYIKDTDIKGAERKSYVNSMETAYRNVCPGTEFSFDAISYDEGCAYKIYTYSMLPSKEISKIFAKGDSSITTTTYEYNGNNLISSKTVDDNYGNKQKVSYTYPSSYGSIPVYADMVNKNMLNYPIEELTLKNSYVTSGTLTTYEKFNNSNILPSATYQLNVSSQIPVENFFSFTGTSKDSRYGTVPLFQFTKYSPNGNISEIQGKDGMTICYLWSYSGCYPIAEIRNATLSQVEALLGGKARVDEFSKRICPSLADIKGLLSNMLKTNVLPKTQITYYSYNPLVGMASKTTPNGVTTYYKYDTLGRLVEVKDMHDKVVNQYQYHYKH